MDWKPGQDFAVRLTDKTGEERSLEDLESMVKEIAGIANKYNFDISGYGSWEGMRKVAIGETRLMAKLQRDKDK